MFSGGQLFIRMSHLGCILPLRLMEMKMIGLLHCEICEWDSILSACDINIAELTQRVHKRTRSRYLRTIFTQIGQPCLGMFIISTHILQTLVLRTGYFY